MQMKSSSSIYNPPPSLADIKHNIRTPRDLADISAKTQGEQDSDLFINFYGKQFVIEMVRDGLVVSWSE